jgi:pyruvate/2-oxoglutarate dehydrogenase complex dihydrolipoamide dehydrogenase (E3) component
VLVVAKDGNEIDVAYDEVIIAVGRKARLNGFGLEKLGIQFDRTIETDEYLQTLMPNIYAAGDVVGPYQFTHVAAHQAWFAAVNALFGTFKKFKVDYSVIPWTTFIDPEVARVGLSERDAVEQDIDVEVTRYEFAELDRAVTESARKGFIKVLTPPGKDKILGVTVVSEHAGDLLAEFVIAMKHGLGLNKILGTIHTYPTWAEGAKYAAGNWKRANQPEKLLSFVEKFHTWRRG